MARIRWRRIAAVSIAVGLFALLLAFTVLRWQVPAWVVPAALAVALGAVFLLGRPAARAGGSPELYASDAYSDAELGRSRPTHPFIDTEAVSEIGEALPADPLRLPETQD